MSKSEQEVERKRAKDFGSPAPSPTGAGNKKFTAKDAAHRNFSNNRDVRGMGHGNEEVSVMRGSLNDGLRQQSREGATNLDKLETGRINAEKAGHRPTAKQSLAQVKAEDHQKAKEQKMSDTSSTDTGKQGQGQGGMGAGKAGPAPSAGGQQQAKQQSQGPSHAETVKARTDAAAKQQNRQDNLKAQQQARRKMGPDPKISQRKDLKQGQEIGQGDSVSQSAF